MKRLLSKVVRGRCALQLGKASSVCIKPESYQNLESYGLWSCSNAAVSSTSRSLASGCFFNKDEELQAAKNGGTLERQAYDRATPGRETLPLHGSYVNLSREVLVTGEYSFFRRRIYSAASGPSSSEKPAGEHATDAGSGTASPKAKGKSSKAVDKAETPSLEKEVSTMKILRARQDEMAALGKVADESDSQPGYWDDTARTGTAAGTAKDLGEEGTSTGVTPSVDVPGRV